MTIIPKKLRASMELEPYYHRCARKDALHDHECAANPVTHKLIEWEHALYFAGKKVQKRFAIVPICWWSHEGPGKNKHINEWLALNRATDAELLELSQGGGRDYFIYRAALNKQFGVYKPVERHGNNMGINYGYPVENEFAFSE